MFEGCLCWVVPVCISNPLPSPPCISYLREDCLTSEYLRPGSKKIPYDSVGNNLEQFRTHKEKTKTKQKMINIYG